MVPNQAHIIQSFLFLTKPLPPHAFTITKPQNIEHWKSMHVTPPVFGMFPGPTNLSQTPAGKLKYQ